MHQRNSSSADRDIGLSAKRVERILFSDIDINDPFFDSFKIDYCDFEHWFSRKSRDGSFAFVANGECGIEGFIYVKEELHDYGEVSPDLPPSRKLKIGSLKLKSSGRRLGCKFVKSILGYAKSIGCESVYFTIFDKYAYVIDLFQQFGFKYHGIKQSENGKEEVYLLEEI